MGAKGERTRQATPNCIPWSLVQGIPEEDNPEHHLGLLGLEMSAGPAELRAHRTGVANCYLAMQGRYNTLKPAVFQGSMGTKLL